MKSGERRSRQEHWLVLRAQSPSWGEGHPPSLVTGLVMTGLLLGASFMGHSAIGAAKRARHTELDKDVALIIGVDHLPEHGTRLQIDRFE